jgi:tetratricopeptide (TPR) repeat protein
MNPGDIISRYRIVARIGQGGMGVVYRAEDTRLRRTVALKFLPDSLDEGRKQRFLNEARAAAQARHPNICPIHDIEEADGEIFIVMALIEGETLFRRVSRGPVPPAEAAAIAAQVAGALAAAHDLGIVHRDIKTSNIMIDPSGHVSIMDFGLALAPEAMRLTGEGYSVGTPDYMSPEQAKGTAVDARTDLWSLGVVLFEMLTGRLPFVREHRGAVAHAVVNDPVPEMPGVPEDLRQIVTKALAKDPADRWPSARAMAAALKGEPEEPATQTIIAALPRRRRSWPLIATAVVVLLALVGLGLYRFRTAQPALPAVRHIAILPVSADNPAVAIGIEDTLRAALAAQPGVTVAPPTETVKTVDAARKYHGATLALTWSAKPDGDAVEFKVDLIDAATQKPIDSRNIRYDPKTAAVSRDQAVSQVFRMLRLEAPPVKILESSAPEASSSYLEGRGYLARYDITGNIDKAIASFTTATTQDPSYALAYAGLAEAYWRKGRQTAEGKWRDLAVQNAEYAARLDSQLAPARVVLGSVRRDAGDQRGAMEEFRRALALSPNHAEASRQLAELYTAMGKLDEAEALYVAAAKARPTDWYGYLLLGFFYWDRERYPDAVAALNQAKALAKDNHVVRYNLAAVYRAHGKYKEALEEVQEGLRIRASASLYGMLGAIYYYQHRFQEAVTALDTATELGPNTYRYWGNLGIYAKWAPGNEAKSEAALTRALELAAKAADADKTDYGIRASMAEYRARLGDAKGAVAELRRIPESARAALIGRFAIVYELTGQRDKAVAVVRQTVKNPASLTQIRDDPDLAAVWRALQ